MVKWPCQKRVIRSANVVDVLSMWSIHHCCSSATAKRPPGVLAAASAGGSTGAVSTSLSTVLLNPSESADSSCVGVAKARAAQQLHHARRFRAKGRNPIHRGPGLWPGEVL